MKDFSSTKRILGSDLLAMSLANGISCIYRLTDVASSERGVDMQKIIWAIISVFGLLFIASILDLWCIKGN